MSYLVRWVRQNQTLTKRATSLLATKQGTSDAADSVIGNHGIKPLYQISPLTTRPPLFQKETDGRNKFHDNKSGGIKDDIKYTIKFKEIDVKKIFKDFYSLYGPLFVVCHIGVSLCSLGLFCCLTYLTIDLTAILPDFLIARIGEQMTGLTDTGGKFIMAYAIHKLILPFRLLGAIWLTRGLSPMIQRMKSSWAK